MLPHSSSPVEIDTSDEIVHRALAGMGFTDKEKISRIVTGSVTEFPVHPGGSEVRRVVLVGVHERSTEKHLVALERQKSSVTGKVVSEPLYLPPHVIPQLSLLPLGKCRHCGIMIPMDEAAIHVESKHKQTGNSTRIDPVLGTCCGDIELLTNAKQLNKLGEGAQGEVWLCSLPGFDTTNYSTPDTFSNRCVVKQLMCQNKEDAVWQYQLAVRLMEVDHPHIIRYLAVQLEPQHRYVRVFMPYYHEKDLSALMSKSRKIEEDWLLSALLQLANATEFLHGRSPPIIHGDIKPENIMLFNNARQVVLMDLDASVEVGQMQQSAKVDTGTTAWMAPEALNDSRASCKSDIWSIGLVFYCLMVLPDFPMLQAPDGDTELLNSRSWTNSLPETVTPMMLRRGYRHDFVKVVADMLNHDEARRPSAIELSRIATSIMTNKLLHASA